MNNDFTNITTRLKMKPTKIGPKDTFKNHENVQRIWLANFHYKSSLKLNNASEFKLLTKKQ